MIRNMKLLVLGGSHFVGRTLAETAVSAGHDVTVLNRGLTGATIAGASPLCADRTNRAVFEAAVDDRSWDAVVDTWAGAPTHTTFAAQLLGPRVDHYGYVSSRSVYTWPIEPGLDESYPVVEGDPDDTGGDDYARSKRGGELGVLAARPDALIARAGLILGPYEDIGRLPWWLQRLDRGGRVLAPGPPERRLQYIDARDLAEWMLRCAETHVGGIFNTAATAGHTTMGDLLDAAMRATGSTAELVWLTPEQIAMENIAPWTELPIWVPPAGPLAALHDLDVAAAGRAGLQCRPIRETVEATWAWLQAEGAAKQREDRPVHGLDPEREAAAIEHQTDSG